MNTERASKEIASFYLILVPDKAERRDAVVTDNAWK